jgi:hypothetical protein
MPSSFTSALVADLTRDEGRVSRNMLPPFPVDHVPDSSLAHAVVTGQFVLRYAACRVPIPNGTRIGISQPCPRTPLATNLLIGMKTAPVRVASRLPSLGDAVAHVVRTSPEKKVSRVYARWLVAMVKHPKTIGNRSTEEFPGQAVCSEQFSGTRLPDETIPESVYGLGPKPASGVGLGAVGVCETIRKGMRVARHWESIARADDERRM